MLHSKKTLMLAASLIVCGFGFYAYAVNPEFDPFAPAFDQVNARFSAIETEITRLYSIGQTTPADLMASQLQHFRDELVGTASSRLVTPELDVVAIYGDPNGDATVHVEATDRPIVLALAAHESTNWKIQIDPGANISKVIIGGNYPQTLTGLPASVPVQEATKTESSHLFGLYSLNYENYPQGVRDLYALSNMPITTLQHSYHYPGTSFQVGSSSQEWQAQRVLNEMKPLYQQATANRNEAQSIFALNYQSEALRQADNAYNKVGVPDGSEYIIDYPKVFHYDPATKTTTTIYESDPALDLSRLSGLAFDSKRNRLMACSYGGIGGFYSFSLGQNQWSKISSLNRVDIMTLTYLPDDDCFYSLPTGWDSLGLRKLLRYNSDGELIGSLDLSQLIPGQPPFNINYQLITVGDRLELVTPPSTDLYEPYLPDQPHCYLINPANGEVEFSGLGTVIPEPASAALLIPLYFALSRRRRIPR